MNIINLGSRIVNCHLIEIDGKHIMIDTGYPGGFEKMCKRLAKNNLSLNDIDYIFLTHAHDDHAGFLGEVINHTHAMVILHPEAKERLKMGHNKWIGGYSGRLAKAFGGLMSLLGNTKHLYPAVDIPNDRCIVTDGTVQPFIQNGINLQVVHLPGHTADSMGLYSNDTLFCGDAAMNNFPSLGRRIIWIENLDDYRRSWDVMTNLGVKTIYPSHGRPFSASDLAKYRKGLNNVVLRTVKIPEY